MFGILLFLAGLTACQPATDNHQDPLQGPVSGIPAKHIGAIPLPEGYLRLPKAKGSYADYLRNLPLKKDNTVYLFNGTKKNNQSAQYAVLETDIGNRDLQQCADAVMRFRADYLYTRKQYHAISFLLTNGFSCDYSHYAKGYRLNVKGNNCSWVKQKNEDYSYAVFRQYLDLVYSYAGTQSLYRQLETVPLSAMQAGHVFLQTRQPYGHALTVMDMAYHPKTGDTIFLLAQSYMPAQNIHVLKNPGDRKLSPWYSKRFEGKLETPEWTFTDADLKKF